MLTCRAAGILLPKVRQIGMRELGSRLLGHSRDADFSFHEAGSPAPGFTSYAAVCSSSASADGGAMDTASRPTLFTTPSVPFDDIRAILGRDDTLVIDPELIRCKATSVRMTGIILRSTALQDSLFAFRHRYFGQLR